MKRLLLTAFMFLSLYGVQGQAYRTISIDGTDDFTGVEDFSGTSGSTWSFTWDANNFYFAIEATDINSGDINKFAYLYIDTDPQENPNAGNGSSTGVTYNTQTPGLPFRADYHFRWRADNGYTNMLDYNDGTSSWTDDNTGADNFSMAVFQSSTFLEVSIPRASLGNPSSIYVIGAMINETGGSESTFFMIPSAGNTDAYDADFNSFYDFELSDGITPNSPGVLNTAATYSTSATGNFNVPASWSNGVPTSTNRGIIQNGNTITLNTDATIKDLVVESGGTFEGSDGSARTLNIVDGGSISNFGTFTATNTSTVNFNGKGEINGNTTAFYNITTQAEDLTTNARTEVAGLLNISGAGNVVSGGNLVIKSDASNTGMLALNSTGNVSGNATVERYITNGTAGAYHQVSPPVSGSTVAGLSSAILGGTVVVTNPYSKANGGSGGATSPFPNFYKYEESLIQTGFDNAAVGWETPSGTGEVLEAGRGYMGRFLLNDTISLTGTLNTGTIGITVSNSDATSTLTNSGWNLIGNPYPAPIDWDDVVALATNTGIFDNGAGPAEPVENAAYIWVATGSYSGGYASYINGVATGGFDASGLIPSMQALFVRRTEVNGTSSITLDNTVRETTYQNPTFYRTQNSKKEGFLRLELFSDIENANRKDDLVIYFEEGASTKYDGKFDARKFQYNAIGFPTILTQTDNEEDLAINGLKPLTSYESTIVPITMWIEQIGAQKFSASELRGFDEAVEIYLEDRLTGTLQNLKTEPTYLFEATQKGDQTNRFYIHFSAKEIKNVLDGLDEQPIQVWQNDGNLQIQFATQSQAKSRIALYNLMGQELARFDYSEGLERKLSLPMPESQDAIMIVRIENENGIFSQKIYFKQP